jgi:NAD(P)-dependent dehydrogenase (short-subunit alcohol dehydrogenase family)
MTGTFGAESTTDEVLSGIDLSGKRVLVTGVSAGLGVERVRVLVAHGANVVGTARDLGKARRALETAFAETAKGDSIVFVNHLVPMLKKRDALNPHKPRAERMPLRVAVSFTSHTWQS